MGIDLGSVELYAGPISLGGPDDLDSVIRGFIAGAKSAVFVAVQELDSRAIAEAILARAAVPKFRVQIEVAPGSWTPDYAGDRVGRRPVWVVQRSIRMRSVVTR